MTFVLVTDVSAEDDPTVETIRYANYATLEDAVAQAEHELATPAAVARHREHFRNDELELHPSGVRVVCVKDAAGDVVWEPV